MKEERGGFGREVYAVLQPAGGCRRGGTKMVEGIKTAVLWRYLLSLRFRGTVPPRFHGNYYFRWKIPRVMNEVPRAVVSQSNFSRWERSCLIFRLLIFFPSLLFNVAWKLRKWFRSSIQLALRNKKIRVIRCPITFLLPNLTFVVHRNINFIVTFTFWWEYITLFYSYTEKKD